MWHRGRNYFFSSCAHDSKRRLCTILNRMLNTSISKQHTQIHKKKIKYVSTFIRKCSVNTKIKFNIAISILVTGINHVIKDKGGKKPLTLKRYRLQ